MVEENETQEELSQSSESTESADKVEIYAAEMVKNRQVYKNSFSEAR